MSRLPIPHIKIDMVDSAISKISHTLCNWYCILNFFMGGVVLRRPPASPSPPPPATMLSFIGDAVGASNLKIHGG